MFNTLNSIATLARRDGQRAERMVLQLARLLRSSLQSASRQELTLREELDLLRDYVEIQKTRYADKLRVDIDVQHHLLDRHVPSLLLQPLVENAIIHGVSRSGRAGHVRIEISEANDNLRISIADNGVGIAAKGSDRFGLRNTRERLQILYGTAHTFCLDGNADSGTTVTINIRLDRAMRPR